MRDIIHNYKVFIDEAWDDVIAQKDVCDAAKSRGWDTEAADKKFHALYEEYDLLIGEAKRNGADLS